MSMDSQRGKYGVLEMGFERDSSGRSVLQHLHREVPLVVQQALYFDERLPAMPCVYILSSGGPHLEGDRYRVSIELGEGAMAHISTGASTIIAPMEHERAELRQTITLGEGAYLEWLPRAIIPAARSHYVAHTEMTVARSATLFFSEVVACGRLHSGERFDYRELELRESIFRPDGGVVARAGTRITPQALSPEEWAFMGSYTHFGSIAVVAPPEVTGSLLAQLRPTLSEELRVSVASLRDNNGLSLRLLGHSSEQLLGKVRAICSVVRSEVKGVPLPEEFRWRS